MLHLLGLLLASSVAVEGAVLFHQNPVVARDAPDPGVVFSPDDALFFAVSTGAGTEGRCVRGLVCACTTAGDRRASVPLAG